jgi:hypothetical protein
MSDTERMPRECMSTVYSVGLLWAIREPKQKDPRYVMAEQLTMAWVVAANQRILDRELDRE